MIKVSKVRLRVEIFWVLLVMLSVRVSTFSQSSQDRWVDSTYSQMTLDQKIGQLMMIRAFSKEGDADVPHVKEMIEKYGVGGICFFQGSPVKQAQLSNKYQSISNVPLLMSIDGEWGLGMRFKDKSISFPRQLMLGAIQDNNLIYEMGKEIGNHCKRIGLHINFAPVVDVNNNPDNPVINDRSFGEDKYNVIAKSFSYMKGLQDVGVMASAKHFPGHGDTDVDSHKDLPVINHSMERLDSLELVPFKAMISQGIGSIMVAHLNIPAIDSRPNRPTTLSDTAVTQLLRNKMAFNGLIFTDAMEMKGVTKHFKKGIADAEAFKAGVDVILLPEDVPSAINGIKKYINEGKISMTRLESSVKRILRAKYSLGLLKNPPVEIEGLSRDINSRSSLALKERLIENAITLVSDDENLVPIRTLENSRIATLSIGASARTPFQEGISRYAQTKDFFVGKKANTQQQQTILNNLKESETVIISLHDMSKYSSRGFGVTQESINLIKEISRTKKTIVVLFGSPYALKYFDGVSSVMVAYSDEEMVQDLTSQALFGANSIKGKLPISASSQYVYGTGIYRAAIQRLGFSLPERVGMDTEKLKEVDELAADFIKRRGAPGGQIFIAKDNKVILNKSYGNFTYEKDRPVKNTDVYDMASVTKICATTISLMSLYDQGKFDLDAPMSRYIPETHNTNKGNLIMRDVLAHQARLIPWIPFYKTTINDEASLPKPMPGYYSTSRQAPFTVPVTDRLFMRNDYIDSVYAKVYESELRTRMGYRYSDLGFIMYAKVISNLSGMGLDQYAYHNFYGPLGLRRTRYKPLEKIAKSEIAPSEKDNYFREQELEGTVHDMGAAMLGGVSGHAGLFSNAYEIGIIMQMLLNGGSYGGRQYLKPETVQLFTTRHEKSKRRGLGFDMKELNKYNTINISEEASEEAFGHLGFTGISAFADPAHNLVMVIVTNRTYPDMDNRVFIKNNYRPKIQTAVYEALRKENIIP